MNTQDREEREFRLALSSWQVRESSALRYRSQASNITATLTEEQYLHNLQAQNEMYAAMERGER
jgi:hypothetical protein